MTALLCGVLLAVLSGCTGGSGDDDSGSSDASSGSPTAPESPPAPEPGACYNLGFRQALSPTAEGKERPCRRHHTAETFHVGTLDLMVDGHQLAVDSEQVQGQVATACPQKLPRFLGGDQETLRLSMIRPVWFTPTLEESDQGADWFRCDIVVVAGDERLVPITGSLRGALGGEGALERYAMCGTAAPDDPKFERVVCSAAHSWRAISVVPYATRADYPGERVVREAGDGCEDVALEQVDDPLQDWGWAYEWPTAEQWKHGMTFGRCWVSAN